MNSNLLTKEIVGRIRSLLDVRDKTLASLLGVAAPTLSTNMNKPFSKIRNNKLGKRLLSLLYVVESLSKDKTLSAKAMLHILTTPRYKMEDGTYLDVISAIHLGDIRNEFLLNIADSAIEHLRKNYDTDKRPSQKSVYYSLASEL